MRIFSNAAPVYVPTPGSVLAPLPDSRTVHELKFKNQELFKIKAAPIFGWFAEKLVVQEKTVSIIKTEFLSSSTETLPIKDIGRVILTETIFYASLLLIGKNTAHQLEIAKLPKEKAREAKELLEGLMMEGEGAVEIPTYLPPAVHSEIVDEQPRQSDQLLDPGRVPSKYSPTWS